MCVYILYHKAWCLPGGGGKVGLTHVVKWCAKKVRILECHECAYDFSEYRGNRVACTL